uniref:hypothetical protein n=1 Tax=Hylemonella sp. TaxID=2066020 RepID=UPI0035B406E4
MSLQSVPTSAPVMPGRAAIPVFDDDHQVEERLPFTVRLVKTEKELLKAVQIRQEAYARHMPDVAQNLGRPEAIDTEDGVGVLLAESKIDGSPLGSVRIQTNQFKPLALEKSVDLPDWMRGLSLAQVSRFGVVHGTVGRLVKMVLVKGCLQYSQEHEIDWDVIAARPPLDKMYRQLTYQDLFPEAGLIPLAHMGNVPHRIMGFEVATCEARLTAMGHPLLDFFCHTRHPDLDVVGAHMPWGYPAAPVHRVLEDVLHSGR